MMIENLKIGCTVSKDQLNRIFNESLTEDNVLDALVFEKWIVEYAQDGETVREELDVMKSLIGSVHDCATWRGVVWNG